MNETEARVRCLEIAERMMARQSCSDVADIVSSAETLYNFTKQGPVSEKKPPLGLSKKK